MPAMRQEDGSSRLWGSADSLLMLTDSYRRLKSRPHTPPRTFPFTLHEPVSLISHLASGPCAVSGRRKTTLSSLSTGPTNVLNIKLKLRGSVNSPFVPLSGHPCRSQRTSATRPTSMFALRGFDTVRRNLSNDRSQYWLQWSKLGTANCI